MLISPSTFYVWKSDVTVKSHDIDVVEVSFRDVGTLSIVFVISEVVSTFNDIWRETEAILKYFEAIEMRLRI